jgi:hypothetical protein
MLRLGIGTALDQRCPTATGNQHRFRTPRFARTNLHCDQSIVHQYFLGEEIGAYCRLVARAELLIDL